MPFIHTAVGDLSTLEVDAIVCPAGESDFPTLEPGAATVLPSKAGYKAPWSIYAVIWDDRLELRRERVRRAIVSAWHRAREWQLVDLAAPLIGVERDQMMVEESATLLAETFVAARGPENRATLTIVVRQEHDREVVDGVLRRFA